MTVFIYRSSAFDMFLVWHSNETNLQGAITSATGSCFDIAKRTDTLKVQLAAVMCSYVLYKLEDIKLKIKIRVTCYIALKN